MSAISSTARDERKRTMNKNRLLALLLAAALVTQSGAALAAEIDISDSEGVAEEIIVGDGEKESITSSTVDAQGETVGKPEEVAEDEQEEATAEDEEAAEESAQAITVKDSVTSISSSTVASGTCGDKLTWTLDQDGVLMISGEGAMSGYENIGWPSWYSYRTSIKSVVINSGVTSIGNFAFYECTSLTSVTISESVEIIGQCAFRCSALKQVTIPGSVTKIGDFAFADCSSLADVAILDGVEKINFGAFLRCISLTEVEIPNSVTVIGFGAFAECVSLRHVTIPASVNDIGVRAFAQCSSLTDISVDEENTMFSSKDGVLYDKNQMQLLQYPGGKSGAFTIPDTVTFISYEAFYGCSSLTSVTIPASVTSYARDEDNYFLDCSSLTNISVDAGNAAYSSKDGVLYNKKQTKLLRYPAGKSGSFTVPNGVVEIDEYAFAGNKILTSVSIPNSVTKIGIVAFSECTSLKTVTLSSSLTEIETETFYGCRSLEAITIPNGVTSIGLYAFCNCGSLSSITIPKSVISIDLGAFDGCESLDQAAIQNSNTSIEADGYGSVSTASVSISSSKKYYTFPNSTTIYGYANSTAQKYAKKYGKPFRVFNTPYLSKTSFTYNGKVQKPNIIIYSSSGKKIASSKYTVKWPSGCKNVGKYTVKVTYNKKTYSASFTIKPKSTTLNSVTAYAKGFTAKWTKLTTQTTGYQIQYSTSSKFSNAKTYLVQSSKTTSQRITGLTAKKKYYVRIRTYKTVSGTKHYSAWSKVKTVTTGATVAAPKSTTLKSLTAFSKGFTATWNKQTTQTTGYLLQYSTSSKFTSAKTVTITSNKTTSKKITGLTAKKKYYVRIRTYKTVSGTKYYSAWSNAKAVTTKK